MRFNPRLLCLPSTILSILLSSTSVVADSSLEEESVSPWPKHVRYWPEDPPHRRRDLEALEVHIKRGDRPNGVMKMSPDPGEKFYMEYWQYGGVAESIDNKVVEARSLRSRQEEEEARMLANVSMAIPFRAPFALHTEDEGALELKARAAVGRSAAALAALEKRAFTCPTGTTSCSAIGYPNSCCSTEETCFEIQDTGLGPVGCCPRGGSCGGTISVCNAPNTACPQDMGGGCCIPNYVCAGVGCVINVVTTVVITHSQSAPPSSTSIETVTTVITPIPIPPSVTGGNPTTSTTTTTTPASCRSDSNPCPASLGGGCCHTERVCAENRLCVLPPGSTESTSTTTVEETTSAASSVTGGPPVRPTSDQATTTGPLLTTDCPVYFYACSARYGGGCCQTGRDCQVTSCPPTSSTTIISEGRTVVVPVGEAATTASPTGACAPSWSSCAPSLGGNCCPEGWECGTASCTSAGPSGTGVEQKHSPSSGGGRLYMSIFLSLVTLVLMFMI